MGNDIVMRADVGRWLAEWDAAAAVMSSPLLLSLSFSHPQIPGNVHLMESIHNRQQRMNPRHQQVI